MDDPEKIVNKLAKEGAGMKNVHRPLNKSDLYEKFRQMHSILKDIYYADNYEELTQEISMLDEAVDVLNNALYLAEEKVTDF